MHLFQAYFNQKFIDRKTDPGGRTIVIYLINHYRAGIESNTAVLM